MENIITDSLIILDDSYAVIIFPNITHFQIYPKFYAIIPQLFCIYLNQCLLPLVYAWVKQNVKILPG